MKTRSTISRFTRPLLILLVLALIVVGLNQFMAHTMLSKARKIRIGDSKEQVRKLMGDPDGTHLPQPGGPTNLLLAILSVPSETWSYGSNLSDDPFQSEFPYFQPIRFRFFGPYPDDIAIYFDSSGFVTNVTLPE